MVPWRKLAARWPMVPDFPEDDRRYHTQLLYTLLGFTGLNRLASVINAWITPGGSIARLVPGVISLALIAGLLLLIRAGRTRLARWLSVVTLWLVLQWSTFTAGGLQANTLIAAMTLTVAGALLFGSRGGVIVAGVNVLTVLAQGLLEFAGVYPGPEHGRAPLPLVADALCQLGAVAIMMVAATRSMRAASARAHRELGERRQAEKTLRESEENYRQVFQATTDALIVYDLKNGRVVDVNNAMLELYGLQSKEEAMTCSARDFSADVPPYTAEAGQRHMQAAVEKGYVRYEWRAKRKSGQLFWAEIAARSFVFSGQHRLLASVRDITERRLAEESLRNSEARLEAAQAHARIGSWTVDLATGASFWSKQMFLLFDLPVTPEPPSIAAFAQLTHPEDRETLLGAFKKVAESGDTLTVEYRTHPERGPIRFLEGNFRAVRGADGKVSMMAGTLQDISERKRNEQAVRESEHRFRAIFETAPVGICLIRNRQIAAANAALVEMSGFSVEELLGRDLTGLIVDEAKGGKVLDDLGASLATDRTATAETLARKKDGSVIDVLVNVCPVEAGNPAAGTVVVVLDVTARKQAQLLREAKAGAEAANRAKSTFLASMSHEIRTPMNAILGFAQLLHRDPAVTPKMKGYLDIIDRNGEHLLSLINNILDLSRIEAGRLTLSLAPFEVPPLFHDIESLFAAQAADKGLQLHLEIAEGVPRYAGGDAGKLRQILVNLIGNALKFTARGWVAVRAAGTALADGSTDLRFTVEDTGPGISVTDREHLFRPFEQVGAGLESGTGTGLGLAISREFARLMGGDIKVHSELGRGTRFHVSVRLAPASAPGAEAAPAERTILRLAGEAPPPRLLIADDTDDSRQLLRNHLESAGFEVTEAADGIEAVAAFERTAPDGIVMDLRMPRMDGEEAIRRIRTLPGGARPRILVLTASAFEENRQKVLACGADDFLSKPYRRDVLLERLGKLLSLEYVDQAASPRGGAERPPAALPGRPATLSAETVAEFRVAADAADLGRLLALVAGIEQDDRALADELRTLVNRFSYDRLMARVEMNRSSV